MTHCPRLEAVQVQSWSFSQTPPSVFTWLVQTVDACPQNPHFGVRSPYSQGPDGSQMCLRLFS